MGWPVLEARGLHREQRPCPRSDALSIEAQTDRSRGCPDLTRTPVPSLETQN